MAREFKRSLRVGEQIQRELALLLQQEVKDPRIGMVTVSDIELSTDLAQARVYVTIYGQDGQQKQALQALNHAAGFLRSELARRLSLRSIPVLRFYYDTAAEQGHRIDALLQAASSKKDSQ